MSNWQPPTLRQLMARFRPGDHACVIDDVLDLVPRGPRHQPRLAGGTRVRLLEETGDPEAFDPIYRVEVLEDNGKPTGYWAITAGSNLTEAPELGFRDWLRALRR